MAGTGVRKGLGAALCAALVLLVPPAMASAVYPGANGPLLVSLDGGVSAVDPETGAVLSRVVSEEVRSVAVAADGRTIFYSQIGLTSTGEPGMVFSTVNIDGTGARQVASRPLSPPGEFAVSPDGGTIAYWPERDNGGFFALSTAGGEPTQLTTKINDNGLEYSPDGTKIVFARLGPGTGPPGECGIPSRGIGIWIANADGSNARPLADNARHTEIGPHFTPDGKRVIYSRSHGSTNCGDDIALPTAVHSVRINGTGDRLVTPVDFKEKIGAIPTPDGKRLLMERKNKLMTIPMDGKGPAARLRVPAGKFLAWAPTPR